MPPKISLIVPAYNTGQLLHHCIQSIIAQTFQDWECICINDGSIDETPSILDDYASKDARFHVIHQDNQGLSDARNAGLDIAQGEFITFIDSDDYIHPYYLEILVNTIQETNTDVVSAKFISTTEGYASMDPSKPLEFETSVCTNPFEEHWKHYWCGRNGFSSIACSKLYRSSSIKGLRFCPKMISEDVPWNSNVMARAKSYTSINASLYYYYHTENSIMRSPWTEIKTDSLMRQIRIIHDELSDLGEEYLKHAQKCRLNSFILMMFYLIESRKPSNYKEVLDYARVEYQKLIDEGIVSLRYVEPVWKVGLWIWLKTGINIYSYFKRTKNFILRK